MDFSTILYQADSGIGTITLNRPEVLNALTGQMRRELLLAFEAAAADEEVRAILLTGSGRGFCSGQDLRDTEGDGIRAQIGDVVRGEYNPLILAMRRLAKPIVGAINGVAAGAGCSLALACDLLIAAEGVSFLQAFTRIGLVPDSGSSFFLPRLVGYARAAELVFLAEPLSATRALELGLVNRVVPAEQLLPAARQLAERLAQLPTVAIGQAKRQLNLALTGTLEEVLEEEACGQAMAAASADHQEGLRAFSEKRAPRFTGR